MTSYMNLEQRIAAGYLDQFPAFVPMENAIVSVGEQRAFYELMKSLYQLLRDEPDLFAPVLHEDDAFPSRYKGEYGKPDLQANVLKGRRAINSLLECMYQMGRGAEVKLNRRQRRILSILGVGDADGLSAAWRWMSTRPDADPVAFAYCLLIKAMCTRLMSIGGCWALKLSGSWRLGCSYTVIGPSTYTTRPMSITS